MARWDKEKYIAEGSPRVNPKRAKAFNTEYVEMAEKFIAAGGTEKDFCFIIGTNQDVLRTWKKDHPEIKYAIEKGKQLTLSRLIGSGIKAAEGTVITDTTVTEAHTVNEDGTIGGLVPGSKIEVKKFTKTVPPDARLIQFLASALSRQLGTEDWVSRQFTETKVSGEVKHSIDAASVAKQIEAQAGRLVKKVESRVVQNVIDGEVVEE